MAKYTFEGKGNSLEDAMDDMYATMQGAAEKRNYFQLPTKQDIDVHGMDYTVGVRVKSGKSFVNGVTLNRLERAYQSALEVAGITEYNPDVHRLKVVGVYDFVENQAAVSEQKGSPSGAGPSMGRTGSLTDLM